MAYHERCAEFLKENWRSRGDTNLPIKAWHDGYNTAKNEVEGLVEALEKFKGINTEEVQTKGSE